MECLFLTERANQKNGFTLLELLVVLVIIGIILSFATLSISSGGPSAVLERETQRLISLLTLASQEAILQGTEFGLSFTEHGYQFFTLQDQRWQVLKQDDLLRPRVFATDLRLALEVEGETVVLDAIDKDTPQLLVLSGGELTPFTLTLTSVDSVSYRLTGEVTGALAVYRDAD
ncbi:MAG: type II secretion system protein GspH [Beggiatoa sp. IS2]|nr:MAG: type II secretion system protein GspH [Beggiatoa sp. IS2]